MSSLFFKKKSSPEFQEFVEQALSKKKEAGEQALFTQMLNEVMASKAPQKVSMPEAAPVPDDAPFSSLNNRAHEMLVFYPRRGGGEAYVEETVDNGTIRYTNIKDLLASFFIHTHSTQGRIANWRSLCIGITSWTNEERPDLGPYPHVPMFDYDGKNIKTLIRKDVENLQQAHGLGPAWVFRTRRGFHVYFFTDLVPIKQYLSMLQDTHCCKGFRRATEKRGYGVLRVSAKYTDFDIQQEYIIPAQDTKLRRKLRKAHVVEALIGLGQQCGTHFASLFPTWAIFQEDPKPWRPSTKKGAAQQEVEGHLFVPKGVQIKPGAKLQAGNWTNEYVVASNMVGTAASSFSVAVDQWVVTTGNSGNT